MARLPGFADLHPLAPAELCQGALELMYGLERALSEIAGMDATTLAPAAGAQGELCGLMLIRAYHEAQGNPRRKVLIPDTAHGTNPASSALNGYAVVQLPSGPDGRLHPETVAAAMDEDVAAIMITNPNTLGLFEAHIAEIAAIVHAKGGLVYGDGANMNALLGVARPGDMGFDVMQYNLHKTFATPHGGGGPGSGPVAVKRALEPFLPLPGGGEGGGRLPAGDRPGRAAPDHRQAPRVLGQLRHVRAGLGAHPRVGAGGARGHRRAGGAQRQLPAGAPAGGLPPPLPDRLAPRGGPRRPAAEGPGVTTMDVAKRLIDHGFHPPTIYFPLVVHGALMIEPTETESKETLDAFVDAMLAIAEEARRDPEAVKAAPTRPVRARLDETRAARKPVLRWTPGGR